MHKRKRDWPQRVWKFWARPTAALPDEFWQHCKGMQKLWNDLVSYREQFRETVKDLPDVERKARWKEEFQKQCRVMTKASGLGWESGDAVLARFETQSVRAAKTGATLHRQFRLEKICIPHRFTGGGIPIEKFLRQTERAGRARFNAVPVEAYRDKSRQAIRERSTEGVFGVGETSFRFDTVVDRQIPEGAIVKQVLWCGDFTATRRRADIERREGEPRAALDSRWHWSIAILLELPPVQKPAVEDRRPVAGLDLGWRVMAEGSYVRIGYLVDSDRNRVELRLPIVYRNKAVRRGNQAGWADKHETEVFYTWYDLVALDEKIGADIQSTKDTLYPLAPARYHAGWVKMRQGGLYKILRELEESGEAEDALEMVKAWQARYEPLAQIRTALWERLKARQEWWYRNLAAWMTRRYKAITWEGDLNLKELAEEKHSMTDAAALKRAQKFRGWASLYRLRESIKQAGEKNWCEIVGAPTEDSTLTCSTCGEIMSRNGGKLQIRCLAGHEHDQDYNAGMNFLQWGYDQGFVASPQSTGESYTLQPTDIPYYLKAVIVPDSVQ